MRRAFLHEFNGRYKLAVRDVLEASKLVKRFIDLKRRETFAAETLCLRAWYHFKAGNDASAREDWGRLKQALKGDDGWVYSATIPISFAVYDIASHLACFHMEPLLALQDQQPTLAIHDGNATVLIPLNEARLLEIRQQHFANPRRRSSQGRGQSGAPCAER